MKKKSNNLYFVVTIIGFVILIGLILSGLIHKQIPFFPNPPIWSLALTGLVGFISGYIFFSHSESQTNAYTTYKNRNEPIPGWLIVKCIKNIDFKSKL